MGVLSRRSGGTNGKAVRRAVQPAGESALREFGCDVAYISDESQTAEAIVEEEIARLGESPDVRRICSEIFDRLRVMYELGDFIRHPDQLRKIVERAMGEGSAGCAGATP